MPVLAGCLIRNERVFGHPIELLFTSHIHGYAASVVGSREKALVNS
jgi:hypothetical protein